MVVRACKVIQINKTFFFTQLCLFHTNQSSLFLFFFFYGSGIKILSSLSKYPTEADHIERWSSVYMLITLKKKKTKCILFSAFWCFASRDGKGLKPKWCCHLLSLILCLTEMLQCLQVTFRSEHVCEFP